MQFLIMGLYNSRSSIKLTFVKQNFNLQDSHKTGVKVLLIFQEQLLLTHGSSIVIFRFLVFLEALLRDVPLNLLT